MITSAAMIKCEAIDRPIDRTVSGTGVLHRLRKPYLLFLADVTDPLVAKTAFGLRDWIPDDIAGQWRFDTDSIDLGLPDMDPEQAVAAGAKSVVIGAAPSGGQLPERWEAALVRAASAGLDIVSGLHASLADIPALARAAQQAGVSLNDIRRPPAKLPVADGIKRSGKRLLTVGTDCAIGKKYTALAIARSMRQRGLDTSFRATGQTGLIIAGEGVALDAVVSDFVAGAAEALSPAAEPGHWDVIEGQGSLFHPSYAGVSLALLHGSQPDALVLCTDAERQEIDGCPGFALPSIAEAIDLNVRMARRTNPAARCVGIAMNTSKLSAGAAEARLREIGELHSLPCIDPIRFGVEPIVDQLERLA